MPKEYQSEKSPIFDSQKSTKTTRKKNVSQKGLQSLPDVLQHPVLHSALIAGLHEMAGHRDTQCKTWFILFIFTIQVFCSANYLLRENYGHYADTFTFVSFWYEAFISSTLPSGSKIRNLKSWRYHWHFLLLKSPTLELLKNTSSPRYFLMSSISQ